MVHIDHSFMFLTLHFHIYLLFVVFIQISNLNETKRAKIIEHFLLLEFCYI